jgi:hypothetical protein
VKRPQLARTAVVLAVVLGAGAGPAAVAQAAAKPGPTAPAAKRMLPAPAAKWTPPAAAGTVESVGTSSFTVKGRNGKTVTVDVTSSTTYKDPNVKSPTSRNVTKGEMVFVEGTTKSGVVTAKSVFIFAGPR